MPSDGLRATEKYQQPESSAPKQVVSSKDITKNNHEYQTIMGNLDITGDPIPGFEFDSAYLDFENLGPKHIVKENNQTIYALSDTFKLSGNQSAAIGYIYEETTNKYEVMAFYKDTKNKWRHLSEYKIDNKTGKIINTTPNDKENTSLLGRNLQEHLKKIESNNSSKNIYFAEKILRSLAETTTVNEIPKNYIWEKAQPEDFKYKIVKRYVDKLVEIKFPDNKASQNESISEYLEPTDYSKTGDNDIYLSKIIKFENGHDAALMYIYNQKDNTMDTKTIVRKKNEKDWHILESSNKVPDAIATKLSQLTKRKENVFYSLAKNVANKKPIEAAPVKNKSVDHEKLQSSFALRTSKGINHDENQDRGAVTDKYIIVCDGAGGMGKGGGSAAEVAKNTIESKLKRFPKVSTFQSSKKLLAETMLAADNAVRNDPKKGLSTAIFGVDYIEENTKKNKMNIASIGDSCFYLIRNNQILKINKEHSAMTEELQAMYDEKIKNGAMSDDDIKDFKDKRRIATKLLGNDANGVLFYDFEVKKGDMVIGVSDGISDQYTDSNELLELFIGKKDPKEISKIILRASEQKSARKGRYSSAEVSKEEDRRIGIIKKEDDRIVVVKAYS